MSANLNARRYLSVWLARLPTDRIERKLSHNRHEARVPEPRIIVREVKSALRLAAFNREAQRLGLKLGMPLADARAMHPALLVDHADDAADNRLLEAICDWCTRYTPLTGLSAPDGLMLDITGCAHLFTGEEAMRTDILSRLGNQGFSTRAAIAGTPGAAWALARYGETAIVADGDLPDHLRPLPLAALRLSSNQLDALARVGLKHIGDIMDRPRAPLAARFGVTLLNRLDQALGLDDEPLNPRLPVPPYIAERNFPEPLTQEDFILDVIEQLSATLSRRMEEKGDGARALQVTLFRVDGALRRLSVATSKPLRDPKALCRLFKERFSSLTDELDPGFGFDLIRLAVTTAEKAEITQTDLVSNISGSVEIDHLIDRLGVRFGIRRVQRWGFAESHIPEYAVHAVPAHQSPPPALERAPPEQAAEGPARPLRLFERPEEVDAIAEVPDGPPARFRWRRVAHEVAHAEGPERISMEWWRDEAGRALTRDYFRIEDREGRRFWLYREGLFGHETAKPRWFVHGLFA